MAQDTGGWDYVAIHAIDHEGVRAYNPGDSVHADNVKAYGYDKDGLVAKIGTKAAAQSAPDVTPPASAGASV